MAPAAEHDTSPADLPEGVVDVGAFPSASEGSDRGLVVLATGSPYWLMPDGRVHRLLVPADAADHVREQLARYERESQDWPPKPIVEDAAHSVDLVTPTFWAGLVLAGFFGQSRWPALTALGSLNSEAFVSDAEWWRPMTSLFLHADADHVLANVLSGIFVFAAWLSTVGRRRGWITLAASAVAGNALIAALHYPAAYRSIGASTAVFAAVGLLTGRALRLVLRQSGQRRWPALFLPLASGLTVLALYGAGQQPVDVGAHVCGFVSGLVAGFTVGLSRPSKQTTCPLPS